MIGICVKMIDPKLFFRFLKGGCHGNYLYGKIWVYACIWHSGIPKRIAISPFPLKTIQWQYFTYIHEDLPSHSKDYEGNKYILLDETSCSVHI